VLKAKQKFLVFAHHQKMLDAISDVLVKKDVKFIRIDGNTGSEQRKYFVDKFQYSDDCLVAVLSITAANAGITLTAAQLVLFAELHWNPSVRSERGIFFWNNVFVLLDLKPSREQGAPHRTGEAGRG
jgi:SWI/SNF-related matrix-associated actin-dependent regulator 1 of chromatin subfamily A